MTVRRLTVLLLLAALALSGCRYAVVETGNVRIEAGSPEGDAKSR